MSKPYRNPSQYLFSEFNVQALFETYMNESLYSTYYEQNDTPETEFL